MKIFVRMVHVMVTHAIAYLVFQDYTVMYKCVAITSVITTVCAILWMEIICVSVQMDSLVKCVTKASDEMCLHNNAAAHLFFFHFLTISTANTRLD